MIPIPYDKPSEHYSCAQKSNRAHTRTLFIHGIRGSRVNNLVHERRNSIKSFCLSCKISNIHIGNFTGGTKTVYRNYHNTYFKKITDVHPSEISQIMHTIWWRKVSPTINSLGPSDTIWRHKSGSTLAQVMACWLTAQSNYLNRCWLIISKVQWHPSESNFIRDTSATSHWVWLANYISKILFKSPRGQWVKFWCYFSYSSDKESKYACHMPASPADKTQSGGIITGCSATRCQIHYCSASGDKTLHYARASWGRCLG